MAKKIHEIRDPIHVFVRLDSAERKVLDSRPLQRLRHIHQLGLSYLVYPSATHKRFEHSLGVMELATRVFDVVTHREAVKHDIGQLLPEIEDEDLLWYWRRVLRMAALCHDIGHLPFSHVAEKHLLPEEWNHERLTKEIILSEEMKKLWAEVRPSLLPEDIVKLAVGPRKERMPFTNWEAILSEIIVGDAFGADRMDYLLRDSHHAGVAYGNFDHYRLIDTLRILPSSPTGEAEGSKEPTLGVQQGGLRSAEALLLSRFFMYAQLYIHSVRRIYDFHLMDFLTDYLGGKFSTKIENHLQLTDNEITAALLEAARDTTKRGHGPARRIVERKHFRLFYQRNPTDQGVNPEAALAVFEAAKEEFGGENVKYDKYSQAGGPVDFPVEAKDGRIQSAIAMSETLKDIPVYATEYVFVAPELRKQAEEWVQKNRSEIIKPKQKEEDEA